MGQDSVWAIVNTCPQTQCEASRGGDQPYRRQRASWNASLCRLKPYQSSGIAVSQLNAHSSLVVLQNAVILLVTHCFLLMLRTELCASHAVSVPLGCQLCFHLGPQWGDWGHCHKL